LYGKISVSKFLKTGFSRISDQSIKDFIKAGEKYYLKIGTDGLGYVEDDLGNQGEKVFVGLSTSSTTERDLTYRLRSPDGASYLLIKVVGTNVPSSDLECTIYGGVEISKDTLHLSRCLFSNATGRIFGTSGSGSIPSILDKRNFGTIDIEQICPSFVEKNIEGPRGELRSAGIISGCQVANVISSGSYLTFDISAGVYFANGIRKEFSICGPAFSKSIIINSQCIPIIF
jgi:hypothetical protein